MKSKIYTSPYAYIDKKTNTINISSSINGIGYNNIYKDVKFTIEQGILYFSGCKMKNTFISFSYKCPDEGLFFVVEEDLLLIDDGFFNVLSKITEHQAPVNYYKKLLINPIVIYTTITVKKNIFNTMRIVGSSNGSIPCINLNKQAPDLKKYINGSLAIPIAYISKGCYITQETTYEEIITSNFTIYK